jgi:hypothetical protein
VPEGTVDDAAGSLYERASGRPAGRIETIISRAGYG